MAHYITRNELVDGLIHVHDLGAGTAEGFGLLGFLEIAANAVPKFKGVARAIQDAVERYQDEDAIDEFGDEINGEESTFILSHAVLAIAKSIK